MSDSEATAIKVRAIFVCGDRFFTERDVIDAALFRGELEPEWKKLLRLLAAEKKADEQDLEFDTDAIDAAAERFRYEHDLITAEETEKWLAGCGLSLDDFSDFFVRHFWGEQWDDVEPTSIDYLSAPNEMHELLNTELILSGEFDCMAQRLSWRVAAGCVTADVPVDPQAIAEEETRFFERSGLSGDQLAGWLQRLGRDPEWFRDALAMEAIYRRDCTARLSHKARAREIADLRLPLTRFEMETIELDSLDAAREALLCVREDGMSMEEVAAEGHYPYKHPEILLEQVPEDLQQKVLSVPPGEILEPIPSGDGFQLCRVIGKKEPHVDDSLVTERADQRILDRHFSDLTARYIRWRTLRT